MTFKRNTSSATVWFSFWSFLMKEKIYKLTLCNIDNDGGGRKKNYLVKEPKHKVYLYLRRLLRLVDFFSTKKNINLIK